MSATVITGLNWTLGPYRITREIGRGQFGTVYEAVDAEAQCFDVVDRRRKRELALETRRRLVRPLRIGGAIERAIERVDDALAEASRQTGTRQCVHSAKCRHACRFQRGERCRLEIHQCQWQW